MLDKMASLGAQIIEIEIPNLSVLRSSHASIITSEIADAAKNLDRSKMTLPTRSSMCVFEHSSAKDFISACRFRTKGMNNLRDIFKQVDVIVSPTTAITAPKIPDGALSHGLFDYTTSAEAMKYIFTANLLGNPAVTCPAGYDSNNMPIGIQFQAKWWNEDLLLRMANCCEQIVGSTTKTPPIFYPNIQ